MEQLRLVAVHDDGEHLIVETPDSTRYRLKIDQQLRQTIQHARRKPSARGRGGSSYGPRDIQARFRAGASVEDVVAESGWEAERVKRYEWPILAERSHVVTEACRVKVSGTHPAHDGYRSVFEGEPKSLEETVAAQATRVGVDRDSFDWDAWLREDQLWTLQLSFTVRDRDAAAADGEGPALWSYNPVTRSVRPENEWARTLGEEPRETGPLGAAASAAPVVARSPQPRQLQHAAGDAHDLLDVLQSRRGQRLGTDEEGDDRLAEILGRGMGQATQRPRPIDAPEDSPVFDRPIQPAAAQVAEENALRQDGIQIVDDSTPVDGGSATDSPAAARSAAGESSPEGTSGAPQSEGHDAGAAEPMTHPTLQEGTTSAGSVRSASEWVDVSSDDAEEQGEDSSRPTAESDSMSPGPRGRTPKARRSSVPSWDDIVFGANRS